MICRGRVFRADCDRVALSESFGQLQSWTRPTTPRVPVSKLGANHIPIRAGRPQSDGCVEKVRQTILESGQLQ